MVVGKNDLLYADVWIVLVVCAFAFLRFLSVSRARVFGIIAVT